MFAGGEAVAAQAVIQPRLFDPLANRLGRGLELARQLADTAAGPCQLDDAPPILRRVWLMRSRHLGNLLLFSPTPSTKSGQLQSRVACHL
jgi:hypothetical protein